MQLQTNRKITLLRDFPFLSADNWWSAAQNYLHLDHLSAMELFNCISRPLKTYEYLISLLCPVGVFSSGNREIWLPLPSTLTSSDVKYQKNKTKKHFKNIFRLLDDGIQPDRLNLWSRFYIDLQYLVYFFLYSRCVYELKRIHTF